MLISKARNVMPGYTRVSPSGRVEARPSILMSVELFLYDGAVSRLVVVKGRLVIVREVRGGKVIEREFNGLKELFSDISYGRDFNRTVRAELKNLPY